MVDRTVYGDTDGTIAGRDRAGDQTVPAPEPGPFPGNFDRAFVFGDAEALADRAIGGDDAVRYGSFSQNFLFGDARSISGAAAGGNDTFTALGFVNVFHGDAETMTDRARGGDDTIQAGSSAAARGAAQNTLYGDAHSMDGRTQGGDDTLVGSNGYSAPSSMYGDAFELAGRARGGDDRLVSGTNADQMWGDAAVRSGGAEGGRDVFAFARGNGQDAIHDFEAGKDLIDLSAFAPYGIADFASLAGRLVAQEGGTLVVLDVEGLSARNSVFVAGVHGLGEADFIFG